MHTRIKKTEVKRRRRTASKVSITAILALVMIFTMIPASANAEGPLRMISTEVEGVKAGFTSKLYIDMPANKNMSNYTVTISNKNAKFIGAFDIYDGGVLVIKGITPGTFVVTVTDKADKSIKVSHTMTVYALKNGEYLLLRAGKYAGTYTYNYDKLRVPQGAKFKMMAQFAQHDKFNTPVNHNDSYQYLEKNIWRQVYDPQNIKWKSSNKKIAKVDKKGVVKINKKAKVGKKVKITATYKGKKSTKTLIVAKKSQKAKIKTVKRTIDSPAKQSIEVGQYVRVCPQAIPKKGPKNDLSQEKRIWTVTFSSNNKSVATVDGDGNVYGLKPGKATITAKCGSKKITFAITVNAVKN